MNAVALIQELASAGVRLSPNGDRLRIEAKPGAVTPELRALMASHKAELLAELNQRRPRELEARHAKAAGELRAHPYLPRAFDVAGMPLMAEPGAPVSVVLAIRHGDDILTGELHIPRERWDLAAFLATVASGSERES